MASKIINRPMMLFPLLLVLYEMVIYLANDAYLPALPTMVDDLHTSHHLVLLTLTAWFTGTTSMQLILGPLADRYGRRPILLIGGIVFIIATLLCSFTSNIHLFLFARFMQGTAAASVVIPGYATIHELFDYRRAIHTLAWMSSVIVLAPALGPLLGAIILYLANWRMIFWLLAIAAVVFLSLLAFKMPETNPVENNHPIQITRILRQYQRIISNRNYICLTLALCFLFGTMILWISAGPFLVIDQFHYSVFMFGLFQALVFGAFISATRIIKPLMTRISTRFLVRTSLIIACVSAMIALLLVWVSPRSLSIIIIAMMIISAASGICFPILNRMIMESSSEPMGVNVALFSAFIAAFGMLSSSIVSSFYNGKLFTLAIILVIYCFLALLLFQCRIPSSTNG
ncbi:MAG: multidrug effflux MFS transporter [Gammaproteobacteria bacterium]|nr:multidrug effflux MFS transporter [Gammaproteobacteria bacterium]